MAPSLLPGSFANGPRAAASGYVLVYDGECGFCRRSVEWVRERDSERAIETVPYEDPSVRERFPELPQERLEEAMHLLAADGSRWEGARAVEELLRVLPGVGWMGWAFRTPGARWVAARAYRWVSRNRYRFGCGTHCGSGTETS
ncbi:MAG: DUF393 domain-containing protein [Gemmatimonadetes bacterium]|nr:DUF393 domain-containing protein [Gemmatimonadota bacterium]